MAGLRSGFRKPARERAVGPEEPSALYLDDDAQDIVPAQAIGPRVGQGELPSCHRIPERSQIDEERVRPYTGEGTESARSTALLIVHDEGDRVSCGSSASATLCERSTALSRVWGLKGTLQRPLAFTNAEGRSGPGRSNGDGPQAKTVGERVREASGLADGRTDVHHQYEMRRLLRAGEHVQVGDVEGGPGNSPRPRKMIRHKPSLLSSEMLSGSGDRSRPACRPA